MKTFSAYPPSLAWKGASFFIEPVRLDASWRLVGILARQTIVLAFGGEAVRRQDDKAELPDLENPGLPDFWHLAATPLIT